LSKGWLDLSSVAVTLCTAWAVLWSTPVLADDPSQVAAARSATLKASTSIPASAGVVPANYRVGPGDELNFRFTYTPDLNTVAQVRADGKVSLPILGEMPAAGLSLRELADQVQVALSQRVRRPEVVINVQGPLPSQRVFVGGEVVRPGVQPLAGALTVLQAVMVADGLKDTAQPREVTVLRQASGGQHQVLRLDLKALMEGREGARDITLSPYDVVIVPRSGIANVGLWVDQYIRRVLPISLGFSYSIGRNASVQ
jgi:protein involved in polysaccharide export with SLBB domain